MTEAVRGDRQPRANNTEAPPTSGILGSWQSVRQNLTGSQSLLIGLGSRDFNKDCTVEVRREKGRFSVRYPTIGGKQQVEIFPDDKIPPETGFGLKLGRLSDTIPQGELPGHEKWVVLPDTEVTRGVSHQQATVILFRGGGTNVADGVGQQFSRNKTYWRVVDRAAEAAPRLVVPQAKDVVRRGGTLEMKAGGMTVRWTPNADPSRQLKQTDVFSSSQTTFVVIAQNMEEQREVVLSGVFQALRDAAAQIHPGLSLERELAQVIQEGNTHFITQRNQNNLPRGNAILAMMAIQGDKIIGMIIGAGGHFGISTLSSSGVATTSLEDKNIPNMRYAFGDSELNNQHLTHFPVDMVGSGGKIFLAETETYPFTPSRGLNIPDAERGYYGRVVEINVG